MAILGTDLSEQGSSTRFSADIVSRRCHPNKEKTNETALYRATGHRRFRGSNWFGTDRRGRRNRAAEPGQCPNHCHPRRRRATRRPTAAAIRRGYGRPAVPPLTTTARLGRGLSLTPAVRAMGLGRRASRDADENSAQRDIVRVTVIAAHHRSVGAVPGERERDCTSFLWRPGNQTRPSRAEPLG